ncbi:signal-induced proliferation-associated 1-like protein 3, partial [Phaenicophaeus curvirostris]|uniref:signal-induced proliferation-associated 1-like protein 3 n=1 Tax=Phaenicophaeus curvirostris TaxID=33595 RepID=UPI0037F0B0B6
VVTGGCEAVEMTLRRNGLGQLGFHVQADGTVAEVEDYGFAWQAGLRQGSRLVEICKAAVVTLTHEQMIDLLRTSVTVKVLLIPPHDDGAPRRGWWESLEWGPSEAKAEPEPCPSGCRPPFRSSPGWQWSGPASHNPPPGHARHGRPATGTSREPPGLHAKRPVSFPESPHGPGGAVAAAERPQPHRQPSGSFSAPGSAGTAYARYRPSPERLVADGLSSGDSSSGGLSSHEGTMERPKPEPLWHVPAQPRLPGAKRSSRKEPTGKESPKRPSKVEPHYSSHSSSNTLSSNASSGPGDDRWFDGPDGPEPEGDSGPRGGSSDSGVDTALPGASKVPPRAAAPQEKISRASGGDEGARREVSPALGKASRHKGGASGSSPEPFKPPGAAARLGCSGSEPPRAPQLSASVPKSFFSRQGGRSKQAGGARRAEEPPEPQKPGEAAGARNVFGQPRLRASLRDLRSPRRSHKSTFEDDLKRLILMDNAAPEPPRDTAPGLPRTLSDESLCGGRREAALGAAPASLDTDVLLAAPFPCGTLPGRRQPPQSLPERKAAISASELALDKPALRRMEPGLMPLPDTASGLEWASLVNAAKAYE